MLVFKCPECDNKFTISNEMFRTSNYSLSCPNCRYRFNDFSLEYLKEFMKSKDSSNVYLLPNDTELIIKPKI